MKLKVPYFKQNTDYTCGPASLAMALSFLGKHRSELSLSRLALTNEDTGTTHSNIVRVAKDEGFVTEVKRGASLGDLKTVVRLGLPVIVNYTEPFENVGHFAVVVGFERGNIILNDPANGKGFQLSETNILRRWKSGNSKRWMLIISEPNE